MLCGTDPVKAQGVIRDTEVESYIKTWSAPVLEAADLDTESIDIILIGSNQINAFVAGGNNMFFFTGLLTATSSVGEVIGVFAHELGHIKGGHLIRGREVLENASYQALVSTLLGIGAAILVGDPGVASGIIGLGQGAAAGQFLSHSRVQESSADQAALTYLEDAGINPSGFRSFLQKLESQEVLPASQQVEYIRTHPLTRKRIDDVSTRIDTSEFATIDYPPEWVDQHARMKAKLIGYLLPEQIGYHYPQADTSIHAKYARAIASYRVNDYETSLAQMDALIALEPNNPYFYEIRGQIRRDYSRLKQAQGDYEKAISLLPPLFSGLIRLDLAHVLLENAKGDRQLILEAEKNIRLALATEERSPRAHRLLATSLGRTGRDAEAKLHLAEEALLQRNIPYAKRQARAAQKELKKDSNEYLRASDILNYISVLEKNQ